LAPIVKKAAPSVVSVSVTRHLSGPNPHSRLWRYFFEDPSNPEENEPEDWTEEGIGSGVIVTPDGYILTNDHVVEDADEIKVILHDGSTEWKARVVGRDSLTDIAVLKVDARDVPAITIADSEKLRVGDLVLAIGNPFGVGQTVTQGIVSARGRGGLGRLHYEDYIQTDAPINPGNSGGALVDAQGRLVGINTLIFSRTGASAGVGFAVSTRLARFVMDRIIRDGTVRRGYLGVTLEEKVSPDLAQALGLPGTDGALVTRVLADGPAGQAGVQAGDFITAFEGVKVVDRRSLQFQVAQAEPDHEAAVELVRGGKSQNVKIALGTLTLSMAEAGRRAPPRVTLGEGLDGVELVELTPAIRGQLKIPAEVEGVMAKQVDAGTSAHKSGLREGCVIMEADRKPARSVDQVLKAAKGARSGLFSMRVWYPNDVVRYLVITRKT
jgi:serine protease Do